jgi:hypothetical protein
MVLGIVYQLLKHGLDGAVYMKALDYVVDELYEACQEYINQGLGSLDGKYITIPLIDVALQLNVDFRLPSLNLTFLDWLYNLLNWKINGTEAWTYRDPGPPVVYQVGTAFNPDKKTGVMDIYTLALILRLGLMIIRILHRIGLTKLVILFAARLFKYVFQGDENNELDDSLVEVLERIEDKLDTLGEMTSLRLRNRS